MRRSARPRLVVFQHERETGLGALAPLLDSANVDYEIVRSTNRALPSAAAYDAALVLGGSFGANDRRLCELRRWVRSSVVRGLPFLGICLGGQLLATALGGVVAPATTPEVGVHDVFLTEAARRDPLFADLPGRFQVFSWHEDSFSLPPGAVPLAGSLACTYQAFRFGTAAYGLQFHPEVRAEDLSRWRGVSAYRRLAASAGGDWDVVAAALEGATPAFDTLARHLLERWLGLAERPFSARGPARDGPSRLELSQSSRRSLSRVVT